MAGLDASLACMAALLHALGQLILHQTQFEQISRFHQEVRICGLVASMYQAVNCSLVVRPAVIANQRCVAD